MTHVGVRVVLLLLCLLYAVRVRASNPIGFIADVIHATNMGSAGGTFDSSGYHFSGGTQLAFSQPTFDLPSLPYSMTATYTVTSPFNNQGLFFWSTIDASSTVEWGIVNNNAYSLSVKVASIYILFNQHSAATVDTSKPITTTVTIDANQAIISDDQGNHFTFTYSGGQANVFTVGPGNFAVGNTDNVTPGSSGVVAAASIQAATGVSGDPQFIGFQGQSFQIHGVPEEYFNLITSPTFQLNSRFVYLATGMCDYNHTECWSHPGTYIDRIGLMFPNTMTLSCLAGSHKTGMRCWFGSQEMIPTDQIMTFTTSNMTDKIIVTYRDHQHIIIYYHDFTLTFINSDWFFNFQSVFHRADLLRLGAHIHHDIYDTSDTKITQAGKHRHTSSHEQASAYPDYPLHGILGQTWKNARYNKNQLYQGHIDDYMIADHQLFSTQFTYNLYGDS